MVQQVQHDNLGEPNNLAVMVERIMAQNGLNVGLRRPNYTSHLTEYVLQSELPRGWKVPKFTKFSGDTGESTLEHITRYFTEGGDLSNKKNLRLKYFPNSLSKSVFTWFTTLSSHSICMWN